MPHPSVISALDGHPVGAEGPVAACDLCNTPLENGDTVYVLFAVVDGTVYVTYVACTDCDVDLNPDEDHAQTAKAELSTALTNPEQLVLTRTREVGPE